MADANESQFGPKRRESRRPWYLVLALLICSGLGACGSTAGWGTIVVYRGAPLDDRSHDFAREDSSKAVSAAGDRLMAAMDEERPKAFPLAAGELVLGIAMFLLAAAAMTGRGGARRALVQIMLAQTALIIATFVLTPKFRHAQIDLAVAQEAAKLVETGQTQDQVDRAMPAVHLLYGGISVFALVLRSVVGGLVIVALTRRRSREYYEALQSTNES
jgi:hypothetical protein